MNRIILLLLLVLGSACAQDAVTTPTNVYLQQRGTNGRFEPRNILGSANPWEAIGFNGSGVLGPISLLEMMPSGSALQVLRRNAGNTALEFATPSTPLTNNYVGYGAGSVLSGEAGFEYDPATNMFTVSTINATSINATLVVPQALQFEGTTQDNFETQLEAEDPTADRTWTIPNATDTFAGLAATQTLTNKTISGASNTITNIATGAITDGTILNADINASAAIALSKLATDPLARANHTGTQDVSTVLNAGTTKFGTGVVGGSITTNPYAPTWTTQDAILYYGATGEIDLPAVSIYTNKTLLVYSTGTNTIKVDPNLSETIMVDGASLGAGVADTISGTAGLLTGYLCDGARWIKLEGGGGTASAVAWGDVTGTPTTLAGYGIADAQPVDPDLSAIAALTTTPFGVGQLENLGPASFSGTGSYVGGGIYSGTMSADATLTMTLSSGQYVVFDLDVTGSTRTLTFSAAYRVGYSGGTVTTLALPVGRQRVVFYQSASNLTFADSVAPAVDLTTDVTGTLPVANGGTGNTVGPGKANVLGDADTGIATNPYSLAAADAYGTALFYEPAAAGEIDLPAGVAGMNILIRNNSANTIDIDPNGSEAIERDGTLQGGGVSIRLSAGAGNYVGLLHDGVRWTTWGYRGTVIQTP